MGLEELVVGWAQDNGKKSVYDRLILHEAVVDTDPADAAEAVFVIIPNFSDRHRHGPCPWSPRLVDSNTYATPSRGDRALVAFSDSGEPWILDWWFE